LFADVLQAIRHFRFLHRLRLGREDHFDSGVR
jgi:hypothetical protein